MNNLFFSSSYAHSWGIVNYGAADYDLFATSDVKVGIALDVYHVYKM